MRTYAEKLKNPMWQEFRDKAFRYYGTRCTTCGQDGPDSYMNHVHHKRYVRDRDPWEYEMDDVTVICRQCHEDIHGCETAWRNLIRSLPSWAMTEFISLAEDLSGLDPHIAQCVAARAKNDARQTKREGLKQDGR